MKIEEEPFAAESERPAGGPTLLAETDETAHQIKDDNNGQGTPTDSLPLLLKSSQTNSTAAQPETVLH